jgi:hypothetical protein
MCLLATMFPASLSLLSQSSVPLTITGLGSREVHLALYDPTAHQAFVEFFADRDWAKLQSLAVVLTNSSPRAIIGLTVRWTVTEQSGDVHTHDYRTDGLFLRRTAVVPAGRQAIITPSIVLPSTLVGGGYVGPSPDGVDSDLEKFSQAAAINVSVDALIFEDGLVLGPDHTSTVASIEARKAAADSIVLAVRQAKEHGEDVPELLSRLAAAQSDQSDFTGIWSARIVGLFRGVQDVEPLLAKLAGLPKPNFHRDR